MADETPKNLKPAKPIKQGPGSATPRAAASKPKPKAAPKPTPKPAKPLKGPTIQETAASTAQTLKDSAAKVSKQAGEKARSMAVDGKARAGGALDELSRMMNDAAGSVDERVGEQYGQYARKASEAIQSFSDSLKSKDIDEMVADAREFVKKSPAVAIGAAAAVGFVLARLVKSGLDAADNDDA